MSGLSSIEKISVFCCFFDRFFALAIAALVFQPIGDFLMIFGDFIADFRARNLCKYA